MNDYEWDVLELLADESYFIDRGEGKAAKPAILIIENHGEYNLLLNRVDRINTYKKMSEARARIKTLVENANYPMMVFVKKYRRSITHKPFAINKVTRLESKNPDTPVRAFNIEEWGHLSPSISKEE